MESWCKTTVSVARVSYKFVINNFRCREGKLGEAIESPTFPSSASSGMQWRLEVFLHGKDKESEGCIGLYLKLISNSQTEVYGKHSFWILNSNQEKKNESISLIGPYVPCKRHGFSKFLKHDFVLDDANGLLMDDQLTICCDIDVNSGSDVINSQTIHFKLKIPESHLSDDFGKLLESHELSDVILSVNEHEVHAHKNVLSVCSPVFAAMFELLVEGKVDITDMDYETLKEMLRFIYTGKISSDKEKAANLLVAADKYALDGLKVMCEEVLSLKLSINNALDILVLAHMHNASQLKAHAIDFIGCYAANVIDTSGWKTVKKLHPHLITEIYMASAVPVFKSIDYNNFKVTKSSYTWIINNFSFCSQEEICSSIFSSDVTNNHKWCLDLFPRSLYDESMLSVALRLKSSCKVQASFKFQILNTTTLEIVYNDDREMCIFDEKDPIRDCEDHFDDLFLNETCGLLTDDKLILRCDLTVYTEPINISSENPNVQLVVPAYDLSDSFEKLFESEKFSDVILSANGHELYAHKNVLSARSPVFAAMFKHQVEGAKHNRVEITDVDYEVLKEMLRFIYTGKVPNVKQVAADLLIAANKYALERLKAMCEDALSSTLCIDNAFDLLVLADTHGADQLKASAINFMLLHASDIQMRNWETKKHSYLMAEVYEAQIRSHFHHTE